MKTIYFVRWIVKEGNEEKAKELLKANFDHISNTEQGNVIFITHQSVENPREFWMYEVWENQEAVDKHENSRWFREGYKEVLRPIVEPDSVTFGNVKVLQARGVTL